MTDPEEPIARDAYDQMADTYAAEGETNPYNVHLEFPGTTSLIPDVDGARVLDAGCGSGLYTEWLLEQGADVVGCDVSEAMLATARERVGDRATFHRADLGESLDFADDDAFDGVVSALVLDYVRDWHRLFAAFARILKPGGFVVFSVSHPVENYVDEDVENYFEVTRLRKEWDVEIPYYHRPFGEIIDPLLANGFGLDGIVEPEPTEAFREARPDAYEKESRQPVFLCVRAGLRRDDRTDPAGDG